jgi:DNA-binding MarR family transcriptional regulator
VEGYTKQVGNLQQKILKHIFVCKSKTENATHIAKSLDLAQPTVRKSVESLIKEGYLKATQQQHKRAEKVLALTYIGAATVISLGATFEQLEKWARRSDPKNIGIIERIKNVIRDPHVRDLYIHKIMDYSLKNNYLEDDKVKNITPLERTKMQLNFQAEYLNSLNSIGPIANINSIADLTNPITLKQFMTKFDFDKYTLKGHLNIMKETIDLVLKQLDAE